MHYYWKHVQQHSVLVEAVQLWSLKLPLSVLQWKETRKTRVKLALKLAAWANLAAMPV